MSELHLQPLGVDTIYPFTVSPAVVWHERNTTEDPTMAFGYQDGLVIVARDTLGLSERQTQCFVLSCLGLFRPTTANVLGIGRESVKTALSDAYKKLGVSSIEAGVVKVFEESAFEIVQS